MKAVRTRLRGWRTLLYVGLCSGAAWATACSGEKVKADDGLDGGSDPRLACVDGTVTELAGGTPSPLGVSAADVFAFAGAPAVATGGSLTMSRLRSRFVSGKPSPAFDGIRDCAGRLESDTRASLALEDAGGTFAAEFEATLVSRASDAASLDVELPRDSVRTDVVVKLGPDETVTGYHIRILATPLGWSGDVRAVVARTREDGPLEREVPVAAWATGAGPRIALSLGSSST